MADDFISAGEPYQRISSVRACAGRSVWITWQDGSDELIDLSSYISNHKAFGRLRVDDDYFKGVRLDELGWAIAWAADGSDAIPVDGIEQAAGRATWWNVARPLSG